MLNVSVCFCCGERDGEGWEDEGPESENKKGKTGGQGD